MTMHRAFGKAFAPAAKLAAALLAVGFLASAAQAATQTCTVTGPGKSGASFLLTGATAASCFTGNDSNQVDAAFEMFGKTGWVLADKNDDGSSGTQKVSFALGPRNDTKAGAWMLSDRSSVSDIVVTLKAGSGFGAFLLDAVSTAGLWSSSKELSHASVYYTGKPNSPAPVPLPAAAWLLLAGMGGLGAAAHRRKRV